MLHSRRVRNIGEKQLSAWTRSIFTSNKIHFKMELSTSDFDVLEKLMINIGLDFNLK